MEVERKGAGSEMNEMEEARRSDVIKVKLNYEHSGFQDSTPRANCRQWPCASFCIPSNRGRTCHLHVHNICSLGLGVRLSERTETSRHELRFPAKTHITQWGHAGVLLSQPAKRDLEIFLASVVQTLSGDF